MFRKGRKVKDTLDLNAFKESWSNMVTFYLGCSYTFEEALLAGGIKLQERKVPAYDTNIVLNQVGQFGGSMCISMRPIKKSKLAEAVRISAQYTKYHCAPVHIGNPARIGVPDISSISAGALPTFEEDDVAVFWACGFSVTQILQDAGN